MRYENPVVELLLIDETDVIRTSGLQDKGEGSLGDANVGGEI